MQLVFEFAASVEQISVVRVRLRRRPSVRFEQAALPFDLTVFAQRPKRIALNELDDKRLAVLASRDQLALEELLRRYKPLIEAKARGARSFEERLEIESYIRAEFALKIPKYQPHPRVGFAGWAGFVVKNIRINYTRSNAKHENFRADFDTVREASTGFDDAQMVRHLVRGFNADELGALSWLLGNRDPSEPTPPKMLLAAVKEFLRFQLRGVSTGMISKLFDLVPVPSPDSINSKLSPASPRTLARLLGEPRESYGKDCQPITNKDLAKRIVYGQPVGPFKVAGEKLAVAELKIVLDEVHKTNPELWSQLGSAGMLCCRFVRGSKSMISNHSWGTAIDITIGGKLDTRGDEKVQRGLLALYPYFHKHGWWWGAEFRIEDAMHFELSEEKLKALYGGGK